ncbi:MAG: FliI/YscN family ATPase [Novosphingobium sp.]
MIDLLRPELRRMAAARIALAPARLGRVVSCDGGLIEVSGLPSPIGTLCRIEDSAGALSTSAEVIGFRAGHSLMMLLGDAVMLHPGACVRAEGEPGMVRVGEALLGRAVDGNGRPIDGGPRPVLPDAWPLGGYREAALERSSVIEPFDCGIRAMNALTTMGVGQRLGILAGSGVGKSVLIDMIAGGAQADVRIVALIGERAREVSDFVSRHMQGAARRNTIVVAVPADHAPNLRLRGAQYATALAEFFRARGAQVLLILDSLTRVAHAAREIGILLGEPGAARGYPPSALATITRLVERAGNSVASGGAITGVYTVLADGDDQDDPVVDTARAILDGHIVLSRELAQQGHYPAIDIPASLSRVMDGLTSREHRDHARALRSLVSAFQANRDLVLMGAYRKGADPLLDRAMAMRPALDRFLQQEAEEQVSLAESVADLAGVLANDG